MSGTSCHPDTPLNMVKPDNLNLYVNVEQDSFYKMIPVSSANQAEEVFNLVNYNVTDEIDEGYSTNYSPSSKSTSSSFECESSLERPDTSSEYVTGQIGERIEDEKGNMMWLVDFKLDFLNDIDKNGEKRLQECDIPSPNKRLKLSSGPELCPESPLNLSHPLQSPSQPVSPPVLTQEPFEISSNKPNYTYTDLITLALKDKTSLTVSEIYQWITDNFPYYKAEDDRWKNSVRHNLSMNPNFRKGGRAKQGTGHVWVLADQTAEPLRQEPLSLSSPKDTTDEAIRKILQSSFPKTSEKVPSRKRVGHHARQTRQTPVVAPLLPPPPPPQYPVQVLQPCVETSLSLPVVQYEVGPASHYPPQYVSTDLTAGHGQHHYDFSVSDSDRLVRALGLDFSEPTVQRELSAK